MNTKKRDEYDEGWDDFMQQELNAPPMKNPYPVETKEWGDWQDGYNEAGECYENAVSEGPIP